METLNDVISALRMSALEAEAVLNNCDSQVVATPVWNKLNDVHVVVSDCVQLLMKTIGTTP
jgi:hypothetical protein